MKIYEDFLNSKCKITYWEDKTWKDWFADLLIVLNKETEGFSGKRPNTDSGWCYQLADGLSMLEPKIIKSRDDEGYPADIDWKLQEKVFNKLIKYVFKIK
jgi:hypothetical protein